MKKLGIVLLVLIGLYILLTLALEPVAKHYVNKELAALEGYSGSIEDIDIGLYRGAYVIEGLKIQKLSEDSILPFFASEAIDISVEWSAIFKGEIVGEIELEQPTLNFAVEPATGEVQTGGENDWLSTIQNLIPITINRFAITDGQVHFVDQTQQPKVDVALTQINASLTNISNAEHRDEDLPSSLTLAANSSGEGQLNVSGKGNFLQQQPALDFNLSLEDLSLPYLRDFTKSYAGFDFKEGKMYVSNEYALRNGNYTGYLKLLLEDVAIIDLKSEESSFGQKVWEVVLAGLFEIFENQRKDQFATKVPFEGSTENSSIDLISSIFNVLENAFVQAFEKSIDNEVSLESLEKSSQSED